MRSESNGISVRLIICFWRVRRRGVRRFSEAALCRISGRVRLFPFTFKTEKFFTYLTDSQNEKKTRTISDKSITVRRINYAWIFEWPVTCRNIRCTATATGAVRRAF